MDVVVQVVAWIRATVTYFVSETYAIGWFFACCIGFSVLRYFFKKFLRSF